MLVGTHALIQEDVYFRQLGLVVTDEQHRFGVNQRSILRRKGMNPDVLTMTATPIPRTLAITAFGDMDVSTLRELPKGRKPIKTYAVQHAMLERVLGFIQREVAAGRQAYIICPLIEESDKLDVQNAIDVHIQLQQHFPQHADRLAARANERAGEGSDHARIQGRHRGGARVDHGDRGWRGRAERHADGDLRRRPLRPVAAAPAARAGRPRRAPVLLRAHRRPEDARSARSA